MIWCPNYSPGLVLNPCKKLGILANWICSVSYSHWPAGDEGGVPWLHKDMVHGEPSTSKLEMSYDSHDMYMTWYVCHLWCLSQLDDLSFLGAGCCGWTSPKDGYSTERWVPMDAQSPTGMARAEGERGSCNFQREPFQNVSAFAREAQSWLGQKPCV